MQINLAELNDNLNPAARQIIRDLTFSPDSAGVEMAAKVRKYLDIDLNTQFHWKNTDLAFKAWRRLLDRHGVFIFKEAFKDDAISGFCIHDKRFSVIYINNSKPDTRQIFTLFHELAHLLLGTGGINTRSKEPQRFPMFVNILTYHV